MFMLDTLSESKFESKITKTHNYLFKSIDLNTSFESKSDSASSEIESNRLSFLPIFNTNHDTAIWVERI